MRTRAPRQAPHSFKTSDLISWLHDAANLIRNLDSSTQMLASPDLDRATRRRVHRSATRALSMLKSMFPNFQRPLRMRRLTTACDLNQAVRASVELLQHKAQRAAVRLEITALAKTSVVNGDPTAYQRTVYNLLLNGVEATAPGGRVTVQTISKRGMVSLVVSDSGVGIPLAAQRKMFTRPTSTKARGSGRGLMVVAATVAASGGTIKIDSEPGKGTTVTLEFPSRE